ncbi:MAG: hypothetical protein M1833_004069 [Piccolia ochrophora]|nr:MAG: hypothetical protein M1833_004069 [Piccolia ochrophora]
MLTPSAFWLAGLSLLLIVAPSTSHADVAPRPSITETPKFYFPRVIKRAAAVTNTTTSTTVEESTTSESSTSSSVQLPPLTGLEAALASANLPIEPTTSSDSTTSPPDPTTTTQFSTTSSSIPQDPTTTTPSSSTTPPTSPEPPVDVEVVVNVPGGLEVDPPPDGSENVPNSSSTTSDTTPAGGEDVPITPSSTPSTGAGNDEGTGQDDTPTTTSNLPDSSDQPPSGLEDQSSGLPDSTDTPTPDEPTEPGTDTTPGDVNIGDEDTPGSGEETPSNLEDPLLEDQGGIPVINISPSPSISAGVDLDASLGPVDPAGPTGSLPEVILQPTTPAGDAQQPDQTPPPVPEPPSDSDSSSKITFGPGGELPTGDPDDGDLLVDPTLGASISASVSISLDLPLPLESTPSGVNPEDLPNIPPSASGTTGPFLPEISPSVLPPAPETDPNNPKEETEESPSPGPNGPLPLPDATGSEDIPITPPPTGTQPTPPPGASDSPLGNSNPSGVFPQQTGPSLPTGNSGPGVTGDAGPTAPSDQDSGVTPSGDLGPSVTPAAGASGPTTGPTSDPNVSGDTSEPSGKPEDNLSLAESLKGVSGSTPAGASPTPDPANSLSAPQVAKILTVNTLTEAPVPSSIIAEQSSIAPTPINTDGTPQDPSETGIPDFLPSLITQGGPPPDPPPNTTLIQVGFEYELNYPFVVNNSQSVGQLFKYFPLGIAYALDLPDSRVTMNSLQPYDTMEELFFITTLALAFIPDDAVGALQVQLLTPTSKLYNNRDNSTTQLMSMINPTFPIRAGQPFGEGDPGATGGDDPTDPNANDGTTFGNNSGSSVKVTSIGIGFGVVCGAAAYGAAMFFIARRYKQRRQRHQRSSSLLDNDTAASGALMGGALMSGGRSSPSYDRSSPGSGGRESRGSGRSAGTSARNQQISAPMMAENSLGWN